MNTKYLAALGVALTLAVSACGSDDDSNNPSVPTIPSGDTMSPISTPLPGDTSNGSMPLDTTTG